jgi:hypothetical protein
MPVVPAQVASRVLDSIQTTEIAIKMEGYPAVPGPCCKPHHRPSPTL